MVEISIFDSLKMPTIIFIIVVIVSLLVLAVFAGYLLWNYHFGKPLAPFFWLRIKGWTNPRVALFEIFGLTNNVTLEEARKETGDGYRLYVPTKIDMPVKQQGTISKIIGFFGKIIGFFGKIKDYVLARNIQNNDIQKYEIKKISRVQNLIMPKSTYIINGVRTIPLWDLHPPLHTDVLEGLKVLITQNIKTLEELEKFISNKKNAENKMFKNYSYRTFYELYLGVRQKYHIQVTTDDVANFIGKQFDKNFRESIEAKDYNAMQKSKTESKNMVWGYVAIILTILIVGFIKIYPLIFK